MPDLKPDSPQTLHTLQTSSYVSNCETHKKEDVIQIKDPWIEEEENGQGTINESSLTELEITDELEELIRQQEEEFFRACSTEESDKVQASVNSSTKVNDHSVSSHVNIDSKSEKLKTNPGKGFGKRSSYKYQNRGSYSLPIGDWNINGKLDSGFHEWLAKRWLAKYDDIVNIHEAKANVVAHFMNQPEKLDVRWEEYQEEKKQRLKSQQLADQYKSDSPVAQSESDSNQTYVYAENKYGAKVKMKDFTGCHQQEQIPVNPKAINMIANFLEGLKGKK